MGMRLNQAGNQAPGQGMNTTLSEEEKKKQQEQQAQESPQPTSSSSQAAAAPTTAPKAAPKQQAAGTGTFSNLKSYIQAAQGGGQQRIAQAASQKVQNVASGAQKEISQSQKTFGNQLEAGTLANRGAAGGDVQAAIKAARETVYQAPQVPQATQEAAPTQEPSTVPQTPVTPAPVEVTPEQAQRFQEIINARYAGPGSIQEAGLYNRAAEKARTAQEAVKQTQTAAGREQLLRNIFSQGRDYSRGQSKLDALLLNTSQQGLGQLQQQAQQAGDLQQKLQQAQTESANTATGRAKEISDIQQQARENFTSSQKEEVAQAEKRIEEMTTKPALDENGQPLLKADGTPMTEWDRLPEYLRGVLANSVKQAKTDNASYIKVAKNKVLRNPILSQAGVYNALYGVNNLNKRSSLSQEEADILGINAGESLYNLGPELLTTTAADKNKLISKNEVARQMALAKLAGLDKSKALNDTVLYDINQAGTQNALSAANLEGLRNRINQEKEQFDTAAKNKTFASNIGPRVSLLEKLGWTGWKPKETGWYGYKPGETGYKYTNNAALENILKGSEYTPGVTKLAGTEGEDLLARQPDSWRTVYGMQRNTDLINAIESSGFLNKAQITENEASKTRAEALRKILASRDKTNV